MKWTPFLAAPAAIMLIAPASATIYLTVEQAQQAIFPETTLSPTGQSGVFRASNGGTLIIDRVIGKHEYIKFALGINANGTIKQIEILEYSESYGYEVREAGWRAQFVGKSATSPLQLNVDIRNISGATLSSRHLTEGVKRVMTMYQSSLKGR
jgi:Na+-translocating ferredoxin:NAD+ oxidoreductase RnfG subunit